MEVDQMKELSELDSGIHPLCFQVHPSHYFMTCATPYSAALAQHVEHVMHGRTVLSARNTLVNQT
jgi:hypothetical protein